MTELDKKLRKKSLPDRESSPDGATRAGSKLHFAAVVARPRPAHKDPVEWMIENLPEEYKGD